MPAADALKYSSVSEVRHYPYPGDGGPSVDFCSNGMKTNNGKLNQNLKHDFELTKDLEDGFFPAPWMFDPENPIRKETNYAEISKKVFGINSSYEWHPVLNFSNEEKEMAREFCLKLPHKKTIMLEANSGSGHSAWHDGMTRNTMRICREKLGKCNFIFASHGDSSRFFDDDGTVSCGHFTVRQTALINNYSDLFVGVSSGISVATSCWGNKPTPKIQYCGSIVCSTVPLANGPIELISCEKYAFPPAWNHDKAELAYESKLIEMLKII